MSALKSTLLHTLELVVVVGVAFAISRLFNVSTELYQVLIGLVVAGLTKFARANDSVPVKDYVNK